MDLSPQNVFCKEVGITSDMLLGNESFPCLLNVKKGLTLELLSIKRNYEKFVPWPVYSTWIKQMIVDPGSYSVNALRKSVLSVELHYQKLKKNVHADVDKFMHEVYILPRSVNSCPVLPEEKSLQFIASKKVAPEIISLKKEITKKDAIIEKLKLKCNIRNVNKRLKRKEEKISKLLLAVKTYKHGKAYYQTKHVKSLKDQVRYYKLKFNNLESKLHTCTICDLLEAKIKNLKSENKELLEDNAELIDKCDRHVKLYTENKYTDDLRLCIMELLSYNIGILKIEPVLKSVFKLLDVTYDRLPKHSTINEILIESRSLSHLQLAEILNTTSNNTLHSDGTTKFNHKYLSYQVATEEGSLTLGLQVLECSSSTSIVFKLLFSLSGSDIRSS